MCGICGYYNPAAGLNPAGSTILRSMAGAIYHRGPDSGGEFVGPGVGLGARRLKLIDLAFGDQPLWNEDKSIVLVCNGEIYNYRALTHELAGRGHTFRTHTDVEVLIHLYEEYGIGLLQRVDGQFAFALYDRRHKSLFLARDHFGICPLYYTTVLDSLVFGSEIKSILAFPGVQRAVDLRGLDQVLTLPGLVSPCTMFQDICSLPPGHFLLARQGQTEVSEYWDLEYPLQSDGFVERSEESYARDVEEALLRSVTKRLHADVPVGFYLSGGLDSSLLAALIRKASDTRRHSFSITFTDSELSEEKYQKTIARRVDSIHHECQFDSQQIDERLGQAVYYSECPLKETYNTASLALSALARAEHIPAILTGEGADELFAGYVGYRFDHGKRNRNGWDAAEALEESLRERLWGDPHLFYEKNYYAFAETKKALYSESLAASFDEFDCLDTNIVNQKRLRGRHPIHQRSYLDFKLRMADHLLSDHGDRMAMANSIEARYPFLDLGVVHAACAIPPHLQVKGMVEKYILKMAAREHLPREIVEREKYAFLAPGSPYLLAHNREWINDLLSYERIRREGYFNPDTVERLKKTYTREGFRLNLPFEADLLIVVITFGIFLETFRLPAWRL